MTTTITTASPTGFRERLQKGVENCLTTLANGFLAHPANHALRDRLTKDPSPETPPLNSPLMHFHTELLRLAYRFIFLLVSEERGLVSASPLYHAHYGISRLRRLLNPDRHHPDQPASDQTDHDLWQNLQCLWRALAGGEEAARLGVFPLRGNLFEPLQLDACHLFNTDLLSAFRHLTGIHKTPDDPRPGINYAHLEAEELGAVHEGLLDWHPVLDKTGTTPRWRLVPGDERKKTGAYYTPPELINELLRSALTPVLEKKREESRPTAHLPWEALPETFRTYLHTRLSTPATDCKTKPDGTGKSPETTPPAMESPDMKGPETDGREGDGGQAAVIWATLPCPVREGLASEWALLSLRVLDPACGSGHFLLATARKLGRELACLRAGGDEPSPEQQREAIREVVGRCLYGVDKNPLAVELCRVVLWLESNCPDRPLSFLDHHIRCGDSLVGLTGLAVLEKGLPDEAFSPVAGDDPATAAILRRQNARERRSWAGRQEQLPFDGGEVSGKLSGWWAELNGTADDTPAAVDRKKSLYSEFQREMSRQGVMLAGHLWVAAFFQDLTPEAVRSGTVITTRVVREALAGRLDPESPVVEKARRLARRHQFFHWALEFPGVAGEDSPFSILHSPFSIFDVVLGNPPWERVKLEEREFFASRDPEAAEAPNAAVRKRLIGGLEKNNPVLWREYRESLHTTESTGRFLRGSGEYPLTGGGGINTYSVFAERIRHLVGSRGRAGFIVPTGIATEVANQSFFADLVEKNQLISLFDFENREAMFPTVHRSYKFCLLTLTGKNPAGSECQAGSYHSPFSISFFATRVEDLHDRQRIFSLTDAEIAWINPNTRTLPVFRTRQDADLTRDIYTRVPVLVNERTGENPWDIRFMTMFHMSNDSHLFHTRTELEEKGCRLAGNRFVNGEVENGNFPFSIFHSPLTYLPLYEGKMIWQYDHRYGSCQKSRSGTQMPAAGECDHVDPQFVVQPRYWVPVEKVSAQLGNWKRRWLAGCRNVTSVTNERTAIFSLLPKAGVSSNLVLLLPKNDSAILVAQLIANLSALPFDWIVRQKLAGVSMNFCYVQQFAVLPPSAYSTEAIRFIVPRVLELTCTAWDVQPFADDLWNEADEQLQEAIRTRWEANQMENEKWRMENEKWRMENEKWRMENEKWKVESGEDANDNSPFSILNFPFTPFIWNETRRARIRAELDAYYARLYGLTRKQLRYILDPSDLTERELENICDPWEEVADPLDADGYAARSAASTFPGETFRVLKQKEMKRFGEYRTRRLTLEAWLSLSDAVIPIDSANG